MKLSFKDLKFILEALEHLLSRYDTRLKEIEDLEGCEEEASDLGNDYLFLESLKLEIEKNINNNESANHDSMISMSQVAELQKNLQEQFKHLSMVMNDQISISRNELTNHDFMISMSQATESQNLESIIQSTLSLSINERLLLLEAITKSIRKEANLTTS